MASSSSKNAWGVRRSDSDIRYHGTNENSQVQSPTGARPVPTPAPTSSRTSLGFSDEEVDDLFSSVEAPNQGRAVTTTGADAKSEHLVINSGALLKRFGSLGSDISKTVHIKVYQPKDADEPIHTETLTIGPGITEVELRLAPERRTGRSLSKDQNTSTDTSEPTSSETILEITTRTKSTAANIPERRSQDIWTSIGSSAKIVQHKPVKGPAKPSKMEPNSEARDREDSTDSTKSESKKDAKSYNGVSFETPPSNKKKSSRDSESRRRTSGGGPAPSQQKKRSSGGSNRSGSKGSDYDELVMLVDDKGKEEDPSVFQSDADEEGDEEEEGCQNPCCCYCNQDFANYCWYQPYSQGQGWCQNLQGEADQSQSQNGPNGSRPGSRGQNQRKSSQRNSKDVEPKNQNSCPPDPCCWPNSASDGRRPSQGGQSGQSQEDYCNMIHRMCNLPEPHPQNSATEQQKPKPQLEPTEEQEEEPEDNEDDVDEENDDDEGSEVVEE